MRSYWIPGSSLCVLGADQEKNKTWLFLLKSWVYVTETISQYNRRHILLSSMCPVLLINMYFRDLESAQSSGAWRKSLEGTASHRFWRLGGIWKVKLREEYISCVKENMFAKTQSKTIWSQCKKKQWNKSWRELLPCS